MYSDGKWPVVVLVTIVATAFSEAQSAAHGPAPRRVFHTSRYRIDEVLKRVYDADVPMGCAGRRLWASSPQGWAFRNDVHWLYLSNLHALDVQLHSQGRWEPARAVYYPSHVALEGVRASVVASASFTFHSDDPQRPLDPPFRPEKRWTCWSSGQREDWYAVDFGSSRRLDGIRLFVFDDAPHGGCRPPAQIRVERWVNDSWQEVPIEAQKPPKPGKGENRLHFSAVETSRLRLVFQNAGEKFYTGLYGFAPRFVAGPAPADTLPLDVRAQKFITSDDVLVTHLEVRNPAPAPVEVSIDVSSRVLGDVAKGGGWQRVAAGAGSAQVARGSGRLHDVDVAYRLGYSADPVPKVSDAGAGRQLGYRLEPGAAATLRFAFAVETGAEAAERALLHWLAAADPLAEQVRQYQAWYDQNVAYFACSDPLIAKLYYHRAYNLNKNLLDPKLGRMQWKAFAEGRWRSGWYPNVISYGGGHQVRESRWLADKSHWQGHLRTFADNEKPDGVYPSHVRPNGPQGGQYTDWITASAWDGALVHPDREYLHAIVDKLAANVRGWQKTYDPDGDGLLLVDSHWWTGMEWQPSFFAFCDYKTDPKDRMHPLARDKLERVDLTAYNFGNAVAVARLYRLLGQEEAAREFDALAEKIRTAVLAKMWNPKDRFFYSLRHDDKRVAPVKEIIGVYPFYFSLPPAGKGYEAAWETIVDPKQFWTTWPVASASMQCPAYSQTGWPTDRGGSGCMWNGPTWPHANSLVLSAMARTLREYAGNGAAAPLRRTHYYELFRSFTLAQYRDQDPRYPWTGEFYNGDDGKWKTAERDYNHSTWLDLLIGEVVGLVPRPDATLEVDPLVPRGALSYFLLDGQRYRGHDVTIVWDDPASEADRFGDGRHGLDVYVDGKLAGSGPTLARLVVPAAVP